MLKLGRLNTVQERMLFLAPAVQMGKQPQPCSSEFKKVHNLGQGLFGCVGMYIHRQNERHYALKQINKIKIRHLNCLLQIKRQVKIMYTMKHRNIARLYSHFEEDIDGEEFLFLVIQVASEGTLRDRISPGGFPQEPARKLLFQLALAISQLHRNNIVHRDIKPDNILLHKDDLKLTDFGLSNFDNSERALQTYCGTESYMAPEIYERTGHDKLVDLWSLGVVTFQLLAGSVPFLTIHKLGENKIKDIEFLGFPAGFSQKAKNLVENLLANKEKRKGIDWVLKHEWFQPEHQRYFLQ